MHSEASQQEIERQLADIDGGVAGAFQHTWEAEEKAICAAIFCVYFEEIPHDKIQTITRTCFSFGNAILRHIT